MRAKDLNSAWQDLRQRLFLRLFELYLIISVENEHARIKSGNINEIIEKDETKHSILHKCHGVVLCK